MNMITMISVVVTALTVYGYLMYQLWNLEKDRDWWMNEARLLEEELKNSQPKRNAKGRFTKKSE